MTDHCGTCTNKVSEEYCCRQMDMATAQYKQCEGWKAIVKKVIIKPSESIRKEKEIEIHDSAFTQFLKKGGRWSFNNGGFFINESK